MDYFPIIKDTCTSPGAKSGTERHQRFFILSSSGSLNPGPLSRCYPMPLSMVPMGFGSRRLLDHNRFKLKRTMLGDVPVLYSAYLF